MNPRKIQTEIKNNVIVLPTWDFYQMLLFQRNNYHRWLNYNVIRCGIKNRDYFHIDNFSSLQEKRKRVRLLITIDFAIALTYREESYLSKSMRMELERIKSEHPITPR